MKAVVVESEMITLNSIILFPSAFASRNSILHWHLNSALMDVILLSSVCAAYVILTSERDYEPFVLFN